MSKRILSEIENFLNTKVMCEDRQTPEFLAQHDAAVTQLRNIVDKLVSAKFKSQVGCSNNVEFLVFSKIKYEPFHFMPVVRKESLGVRLSRHSMNLSIAHNGVESLSREINYYEEESLKEKA